MASRRDRREQAKRARRKASLVPEAELYRAPEDGTQENTVQADLVCGCRIVTRTRYLYASPVYFAILWVRESSSGQWIEQYSCDSGHGHYHEHVHGHRGKDRRDIMPLHTQVDVQECWDDAYDRVTRRHDQSCRG